MSDPQQPDATLREELVAYLDGELPPEKARAVEERLSRDELYRREMQGFDRAWSALEELPRATVDDSFPKTTIEMVAVAAEKDLAEQTQSLPLMRRRRTLWVAAIAAVAATLGFALARIAFDRPDRILLTYLPVVQHLDAYSQDLSPEFLTALQKQASDILKPYEDVELQRELESYRAIDAETIPERRARVEKMSDGEKATLRANYIRFRELPEQNRERLVTLHDQLRDAENSAELQRTMLAYWAWLEERRNGGADQADLRGAESTEARLKLIHEIDHGENRRLSLSPDEAEKLRAVVKSFDDDPQFKQILERISKEPPTRPEPGEPGNRGWMRHPLGILYGYTQSHPDDTEAKQEWDRISTKLLAQLSPINRAAVERDGGELRLIGLVGKAMFQGFGLRLTEDELRQYFASDAMPADRIQELLAMPRDRMLQELREDYLREQFGPEAVRRWREGRRGREGDRFDRRDGPPDGPPRRGGPRFNDFRDRGPGPRDDRERRPPGPPPEGEPFGPPPGPQGPPPPRPEDEAI